MNSSSHADHTRSGSAQAAAAGDQASASPAPHKGIEATAAHAGSATHIAAQLQLLQQRVDAAAAGRQDVRVLLATKTQPVAQIRSAMAQGYLLIGENRVQELVDKAPLLEDLSPQTHLIGPLQRNKVNLVLAAGVECIESVDSIALATKLNNRLDTLNRDRSLSVYLQVNTSGEDSKSGVAPADLEALVTKVRELAHLEIGGLMTIGLNSSDPEAVRPSYARLRELSLRLREREILPGTASQLSMGMSQDFELAIAEGATVIRVGSSVFGRRASGR